MSALARGADRTWRTVGTGLSFAVFGLGGLVLGFVVCPILRFSTLRREVGVRRVRHALSAALWFFLHMVRWLRLISWTVEHRERLAGSGRLVVANHPTLIDVVFLIALMPGVGCIVKQALWHNPFLRWPVVWAGYISNATGDGLVAACVATLRAGRSLIVFPEGTRSVPGQPLKLKRGAAQIALAAGTDPVPVTITCSPDTLYKGDPWYRVPARRPRWTVVVGEPLPLGATPAPGEPTSLAARHLTRRMAQYFEGRAGRNLLI